MRLSGSAACLIWIDILLTGSRDINRALVHDVHQAYISDGLAAGILEIADLGHEQPSQRASSVPFWSSSQRRHPPNSV